MATIGETQRLPREDVLRELGERGYGSFEVADGGVVVDPSDGTTWQPERLEVDETHRYEGVSNPGDEEIIFAVHDPESGRKGAIVMAYGAYASADEAEVARGLSWAD